MTKKKKEHERLEALLSNFVLLLSLMEKDCGRTKSLKGVKAAIQWTKIRCGQVEAP